MYISMKFGMGVHVFCWEAGVFNRSCFRSVSCKGPPRWRRGSGLDCGSEDPGSIPGIFSLRVGPLMARRLKTSSDVPVPVSV